MNPNPRDILLSLRKLTILTNLDLIRSELVLISGCNTSVELDTFVRKVVVGFEALARGKSSGLNDEQILFGASVHEALKDYTADAEELAKISGSQEA